MEAIRRYKSTAARAAFFLLSTWGLATPMALGAKDYSSTPVFGGQGGGSFQAYCPKGTFLVGIAGRTGEWIDAIQPLCAGWYSSRQASGTPFIGGSAEVSEIRYTAGPATGGGGGGAARLMCPTGMVVRGWEIARTDNTTLVRYVRPQCEAMNPEQPPSASIPGQFGGAGVAAPGDLMGYKCPPGQFAVGIYGSSGAYLDNAGLNCEVGPLFLGRPVPAPEPVKSIGRVPVSPPSAARPQRSICEMARDARARNSPAAPNLEAQCRVVGERPPTAQSQPSRPDDLPTPGDPPRRAGMTYDSPMIVAGDGQTAPLDFCREFGQACGKPAADAFCRQKGHPNASRFQISENIGHTALISTGDTCDHPSCDGFTQIQCNADAQH